MIDFPRLGKRLPVLHSASRTTNIEKVGDWVWDCEVGAMHSCGHGLPKGHIRWSLRFLQIRGHQVRREHSYVPDHKGSRRATHEN